MWQFIRYPEYKAVFNAAGRVAKKAITEHKNELFQNFICSLGTTKETDYKLCKVAKACGRPISLNFPLQNPAGGWVHSDLEKA